MQTIIRSRNIHSIELEAELMARNTPSTHFVLVGLPVLADDEETYESEVEVVRIEAGENIKQRYWNVWKIIRGGKLEE